MGCRRRPAGGARICRGRRLRSKAPIIRTSTMIVVLTGGTGAAKFMQGLQQVAPARELVAIVNTGDDLIWWGLHVSPDVDSITHGRAGLLSTARAGGVERCTFEGL